MGLDVPIIVFQRQKAFNFTGTEKFLYALLDGIVHFATPCQNLTMYKSAMWDVKSSIGVKYNCGIAYRISHIGFEAFDIRISNIIAEKSHLPHVICW
jgi:hypothetical protein